MKARLKRFTAHQKRVKSVSGTDETARPSPAPTAPGILSKNESVLVKNNIKRKIFPLRTLILSGKGRKVNPFSPLPVWTPRRPPFTFLPFSPGDRRGPPGACRTPAGAKKGLLQLLQQPRFSHPERRRRSFSRQFSLRENALPLGTQNETLLCFATDPEKDRVDQRCSTRDLISLVLPTFQKFSPR